MAAERIPFGDDALELSLDLSPRQIFALAERLVTEGPFEEAVPGIGALSVRFDPLTVSAADALARLDAVMTEPLPEGPAPREHEIKVAYGGKNGPDLPMIADTLGLDEKTLIDRHAEARHEVVLIGFMPGFAYLSGAEALDVPRLQTPRLSVPAGSVGLAGGRTGLYAQKGPGGWPLIGGTDEPLWTDDAPRLRPGDRVRFVPS